MSLPVLTKTWQFVSNGVSSVNQQIVAQGTPVADNRRLLLSIKNALKGFANNPWTVVSSSNGTVAGAGDNWASDTDLNWGGNTGVARSWIVLKQAGVAANFQICLDLVGGGTDATNGYGGQLFVSASAGFTGGTTTARPTATDESAQAISANGGASGRWSNMAGDINARWTAIQSTDGACTRFWFYSAGVLRGFYLFDKPANPATGWANPSYVFAGSDTTTAKCAGVAAVAAQVGRFRYGAINGLAAMGCETGGLTMMANDSTGAGAGVNDISGEWPMLPIGISSATAGARGRHGSLVDIWMGSNAVSDGDTYPVATTDFVQVGCLILPWNGGPVNLS